MEAYRTLSRTKEGRDQIHQHLQEIIHSILNFVDVSSSYAEKDVDDAIATLANLFSDDGEDGKVLKACIHEEKLFPTLFQRLKQYINFPCICICLSNAYIQSKSHRTYLKSQGIFEMFFYAIKHDKFGFQALGALIALFNLEDDKENSYEVSEEQLHQVCEISNSTIQRNASQAFKLLVCNNQFFKATLGNVEDLQLFSQTFLKGLTRNRRSLAENLEIFSSHLSESPAFLYYMQTNSTFYECLMNLLPTLETNSEVLHTLLEIFTKIITSTNKEVVNIVFEHTFNQEIDVILLDIVTTSSTFIPFEKDKRVTDQSVILPHAGTRLLSLTNISTISSNEARARHLLHRNAHLVVFNIALNYFDYDYEATRACLGILKNLMLADSRQVVMDCNITAFTASLLLKSQDHNAGFAVSGIFRIACSRTGKTDFDSFSKLAISGNDLIQILSVDLVKIHPHTRVELARAFASLMESIGHFSIPVACLETTQAVKFVSFLFQAPQPEIQLEALHGLCGLPTPLLQALPSFELEIVSGVFLIKRLKHIYSESKDSIDSMTLLNVAASCEVLFKKMGIEY